MYRLTETHPNYGLAGLMVGKDNFISVPYNDKDLFEPAFEAQLPIYAKIAIQINDVDLEYTTFDHHELLAIVMKYMEPGNLKFLQKMIITGYTTGINSQVLFMGLEALKDIYPFTGGLVPDFVIIKYKFELDCKG